jgi:hypothetical protein
MGCSTYQDTPPSPLVTPATKTPKSPLTPATEDIKPIPTKVEEFNFTEVEKTHFSRVGRALDAYWIRVWIAWDAIERKEGVMDFSYSDWIVRSAQNSGGMLLITILPFAKWDQDKCHGDEYYAHVPMPEGERKMKVGKPCNMEDYLDFLRVFVERYDGDGIDDMPGLRYPVRYWEIMNEPEMRGQHPEDLKFFHGTPQDYLEILKESYKTIKDADPNAKVLMGGMAGMLDRFVNFWEPIMDDAKEYFDIANIHSIDTTENREDLYVAEFKQFLREHNVEKSIWITEAQFGRLEDRLSDEFGPIIVRATVLSLALGADKIFYISDNWGDKKILDVYKTIVRKLNRFENVTVIDQKYIELDKKGEGVRSAYGCYRFNMDGKRVYVVWGTGELSRFINTEDIKTVKITDIYGNEKIMDVNDVQLSRTPIYVEIVE